MFTNLSKIPIKLAILLVGFGLLVVGCDSAGPSADGEEEAPEVSYEVTNDLGDRITALDGNSSSNAVTMQQKKSTVSFEATHKVSPPTNIPGVSSSSNVRASHLAFSSNVGNKATLYVGYKVIGSPYGGGIDILRATGDAIEDGGNSGKAEALVTGDVDIQELAVKEEGGEPDVLFAATAIDPQPFQSAPQLHSINVRIKDGYPGSPVEYEAAELENPNSPPASRIAKSVVNNSSGAYAVSDAGSFHSLTATTTSDGQDLSIEETIVENGAEFRAVEEIGGRGYALSDNGNIYEYISNSGMSDVANLPTISSDSSIARLSSGSFDVDGSGNADTDLLFASLNEDGFRVINPSTGNTVFSDPDIFATAVAVGDSYVYVANGDGFAVYDIEASGLGNSDPNDGLVDVGRASINELTGQSATEAQVNHILTDPNQSGVIYVAKSTDGVYRVEEIDGGVY